MRRVFPPPSDASHIAALLQSEDALTGKARLLPPKQRDEVERELAEIGRLLEQLGYRRSA